MIEKTAHFSVNTAVTRLASLKHRCDKELADQIRRDLQLVSSRLALLTPTRPRRARLDDELGCGLRTQSLSESFSVMGSGMGVKYDGQGKDRVP